MIFSRIDIDDFLVPSSTRLIDAVKDDNENLVHDLLQKYKINVVSRVSDGVLYHAVMNENLKILEMLLQHGAYPNEESHNGPLIDYAFKNNLECAEIMLRYGARCNINNYFLEASIETERDRRRTHLYYRYVDLEARDDLGNSIVHLCVMMKDPEGLMVLAGRKANMNQRSLCDGLTPLHTAAKMLYIPCLKLLLRYGADISMRDEYGYGLLHLVITCANQNSSVEKQLEVLEWLLESGSDVNLKSNSNVSVLHLVSSKSAYKFMVLLLRYGADPNAQDDRGRTPIFRLAENMSVTTEEESIKSMQLLISAGADVNIPSKDGVTPLHILVGCTRELPVKLLLNVGARVNVQDKNGYTPLHTLAMLPVDCTDKIKQLRTTQMLLDAGADINIVSIDEKTPFLCAVDVKAGGIIRSLIKHMNVMSHSKEQSSHQLDRAAVASNAKYSDYYINCYNELAFMKSVNFGKKPSLLHFLTKHSSQVMNDADKDIYVTALMNKNFKRRIKIFYGILRRKYYEAMKRKILMDNATVGLSMAMKVVETTHLIADNILKHLRNDDLVNLGLVAGFQEKELNLLPK